MLDNTEFEWVSADATPVLLYPGFTSDDALVEPGEIVAAVYDSSDGIALYGSRDKVLALLLRLADAVRNAPPVPATEACIAATTDPSTWKPGPLTESLAPTTRAWPLCDAETPQPIAADPRLATCTDCVNAFNAHGPQTPLRLVHFLPDQP
ncbi:hypothetical protein ACFV0H_06630 [Streptomyces erythrochromogenes]|uniref:hypothetical protein n=1 Tax=Streptomyces erythrochromogenes TaxID=285574 RepID=UPI0036B48B61